MHSRRAKRRQATWYGPGFYGNDTACGKRLRRSTIGVAHKKLPCGTRVTFNKGGRWLRAKVIDRGPYSKGVRWDLTEAAAQELGYPERSVCFKPVFSSGSRGSMPS